MRKDAKHLRLKKQRGKNTNDVDCDARGALREDLKSIWVEKNKNSAKRGKKTLQEGAMHGREFQNAHWVQKYEIKRPKRGQKCENLFAKWRKFAYN